MNNYDNNEIYKSINLNNENTDDTHDRAMIDSHDNNYRSEINDNAAGETAEGGNAKHRNSVAAALRAEGTREKKVQRHCNRKAKRPKNCVIFL